ncbi:MAG: hypothetical protein V1871_08565 [Planctomycetota bacterium]
MKIGSIVYEFPSEVTVDAKKNNWPSLIARMESIYLRTRYLKLIIKSKNSS